MTQPPPEYGPPQYPTGQPPYPYEQQHPQAPPPYPAAYQPHGAPPPGYRPYGYPAPQPSNNLGTTGFVTGLLGLLLFWVPVVNFALSVLGIVFGGLGMSRGKTQGSGTGLAIAGLVLGVLGLIVALVVTIAIANS